MSPQLGAVRQKWASVAEGKLRESAEATVTTLVNLAYACGFANRSKPHFGKNRSGRRGSNSQLSAWEFHFFAPLILTKSPRKINVHARHANACTLAQTELLISTRIPVRLWSRRMEKRCRRSNSTPLQWLHGISRTSYSSM